MIKCRVEARRRQVVLERLISQVQVGCNCNLATAILLRQARRVQGGTVGREGLGENLLKPAPLQDIVN